MEVRARPLCRRRRRRGAKSKRKLRSAKILLEAGEYEDAISRVYYAFFEIASTALLTKKIIAKTHHGVLMLFSRYFVETKKVPVKISRWMQRARKAREEADYEIVYRKFDKEIVERELEVAREFVKIVEKVIWEEFKK